jgi:hypothetical protein
MFMCFYSASKIELQGKSHSLAPYLITTLSQVKFELSNSSWRILIELTSPTAKVSLLVSNFCPGGNPLLFSSNSSPY